MAPSKSTIVCCVLSMLLVSGFLGREANVGAQSSNHSPPPDTQSEATIGVGSLNLIDVFSSAPTPSSTGRSAGNIVPISQANGTCEVVLLN